MKKGILLVLVVLAQIIAGITAHAQTTTIFDYGSNWKYLDNGTNQGTAWKDAGFNDAGWPSDVGVFGYGDSWITKCVNACGTVSCSPSCGTKYITTYFRKTINIADVNVFDSIRFNLWRDDGMVVYVNGVEVWRDNLPTGTIAFNTLAPSAIGGSDENTPIVRSIPISAFVNGNNVIAIELHQNAGSSSDLTFNMKAMGIIRTNIFAFGSSWKYLDNGSNQGTAWSGTGFNDAAWASGTGYFGYGESWTNTCVNACGTVSCNPSCGTKYITTYFRKTISVLDVALFDSIRLSMYRDDGAVVYVNGVEVWRDNMPTGTIGHTTLANSPAIGGSAETTAITRSIPISAFVNGVNTIAVEIHQQAASSSDLNFNMSALAILRVPAVPVSLVRGPYLQMGNQTAVSVRWRTNVAARSRLSVGTVAGTYPIVVNNATPTTEHELRVTGLNPNTKYYYRIGTDTSILQGDTTNFFVTMPADGAPRRTTLAAFGDCGRNDNGFQTTTLAAYRTYLGSIGLQAADALMLLGDNAYNSGLDAEFQTGFFNAYSGTILKNHMLFPAPGNHDYYATSTAQDDKNIPYYSMFTMPTAGECGGVASGTEAFYSYNVGDVHVLSLDSYGRENAGTTRMYDTLGAQVTWIKADLAANTKKWVIAYWHHPPYTMGSHNSDGEGELINIRQNFIRILERYGVDVIMCGHSHDYERSYLLKGHFGNEASFNKAAHTTDSSSAKYDNSVNSCPYTTPSGKINHGTVYVVSGSSGADGGVQGGYPHNALPFAIDDGGMFFLDFNEKRLDAKFIRRDNTIGDKFTIVKDTKVTDTIEILHGNSVNLTASWPGTYSWAPGVTTRTVTVTPTADTTIVVKDNATGTCLTDRHFIDLQCTMPDIISSPSDIVRDGCNAMVTYAIADSGRPAPAITYAFTGATTGSGNGTGSGSTFSVGVTTVTITAANECGTANRNFRVTIQPLPTVFNVTGGGGYCPGGSGMPVGLSNSQTGVTYRLYNGASAVGTSVAGTGGAISFGVISPAATYTVLATDNSTGCTSNMSGNATVFVHSLPAVYNVTGGGNYCAGASGSVVGLSNSQTGINYRLYNGVTPVGSIVSGTGLPVSFGSYTAAGTYSVQATNATTTCVNNMSGSATIGINPLPVVYNVIGGGSYCNGGTGVMLGLNNTQTGVNYQAFRGSVAAASPVAGSGSSLSMGTFTTADIYTVNAVNATTGCANAMTGSASISINPLPSVYAISGGGSYCAGGTGVAIGLAGSQMDVTYRLYNGTVAVGFPVAGGGSSISLGTLTDAGNYSVSAINSTTSCASLMAGIATVVVNELPAIYSVTGGGNYCAGGSGVHLGLGGSTTGIQYQLYNGAATTGTPVIGTGVPLDFGLKTAAGTYSVLATNISTTCTNSMFGSSSVIVTPLVTPSVTITSSTGTDVCSSTPVTYNASATNGGISPVYNWYVNGLSVATGSSVYSYTPLNGNVISVQLTSSTACVTTGIASSSVTMTVRPHVMPTASISVSPNDTVCEGIAATYTATITNGGTSPSLKWLTNSAVAGTGNTYTYTPDDADGIVLTLTSNAPCRLAESVNSNVINMQVDETNIPVVSISAIPGENIAKGQVVVFTANVSNAGAAPTYKWSKNGTIIPGATLSTFSTGNLNDKDTVSCSVKSTGICGLEGFNSLRMNVYAVGIDEISRNGAIRVVPNPTSGTFTIEGTTGSAINELVNVSVTNILGQTVFTGTTQVNGGTINAPISLSNNLADGMYLLTVNTSAGSKVFHLVLRR
jgi:hypothetical protein